MEEPVKHLPKQLEPYKWKKGQSGNPHGRPKGKTLKEFAREYLESLPDDEKIEYLASLPTELTWRMAEGNPTNENDLHLKGDLIIKRISFDDQGNNDTSQPETPTSTG